MKYDRQITYQAYANRKDSIGTQVTTSVSDFVTRLNSVFRSAETYDAYMKLTKAKQDDLKDVGGYIPAVLKGMRRKAENVTGRDSITLDFDNIPNAAALEEIIDRLEKLGCHYIIHSTRKHTSNSPRVRIIIILDRTVTPDEYEPCARRVAEYIGIAMADPTTFQVHRLMYWPSCCSDSEFYFKTKDAPLIHPDFLLETYADWHDFQSWPQVPNAISYKKLAMKQGDPTEKTGTVGAFCRTYDVYAAMDKFLPGIYDSCDNDPTRFTYLGGSTTGGAIIYDDGKFLFSHHATDPCSGRLVNAFDLIRLHKFGDLDDNATPDTPIVKLPSYSAMCSLALGDKAVLTAINKERLEEAVKDFEGIAQASGSVTDARAELLSKLERSSNGSIKKTATNVMLILEHDPELSGRIKKDSFIGEIIGQAPLPWGGRNTDTVTFHWTKNDDSGLRNFIEHFYEIRHDKILADAFEEFTAKHAFNPVQNYLNSLVWDGTERLDSLFIDYLGAENNEYNRAVTRKIFTAAVARAMTPGVKFDNMLILCGKQGVGKSTILDKMSRGWFNDNIRTFEGKDASELLRGAWLVEIAELDAFRKSDVSRIKQFLSLRADRYRAAYAVRTEELPRSCVFFGTCNNFAFLQDSTGNRRFWPVDVMIQKPTKNIFKMTDEDINQLWAEAKMRWQAGEELFLKGDLEYAAQSAQELHYDSDAREGMVAEFLDKPIPVDWEEWTLDRRRDFWAELVKSSNDNELQLVTREKVCIAEILAELFLRNPFEGDRKASSEIARILRHLGWQQKGSSQKVNPTFGKQKCFYKPAATEPQPTELND